MKYEPKVYSRREMLSIATALGGLALAAPLSPGLAQELKRHLTPEQAMGPFYPVIKQLDRDADMTRISGKRGLAQGKVTHVTGRVLNSKGEPVRGARIELWQANAHGRYDHPTDTNPAPLDPNFQGYALQLTDAEGRYHFKTVKPGAYPIGDGRMRPPHIHFDVSGKKDRLVTQMYFPDEPLNEKDFIFNGLGSEKDAAIAKLHTPTKEMGPDSLLVVWDIVLDRG